MGETTGKVTLVNEVAGSPVQQGHGSEVGTIGEAAQIRSGIDETRSNLSATLDALQDKLDPSRIAEQVKDQIRDKATEAYDTAKTAVKEATIGKVGKMISGVSETVSGMTGQAGTAVSQTGSSVVQYIRENPIPLSLMGLGLGMLFLQKRQIQPILASGSDTVSSAASNVADLARSAADRTTTVVNSATGSVRDFASSAADTTRQQFHDVTNQAQQGARVATDRLKGTLQDNPMALGIAALAAGALVGLSLPSTQVESEYMGETRDRLVDQAKSMAQEAAGKVSRVAGEAGHALQETAKKEGLVGS